MQFFFTFSKEVKISVTLQPLTKQIERWNFSKDLSLLEACFDLISGSSLSMKIQILGGKITENLGFKSPLRKVNFFLSFFDCEQSSRSPKHSFVVVVVVVVIFDFQVCENFVLNQQNLKFLTKPVDITC